MYSYANLVIAEVSVYLNVRKTPESFGEVVGKLPKGGACEILDTSTEGWYKISSGGVTGYVSSQYVYTGDEAKKLAAENEKPVGEQTIDQLLGQNQGATNIEIEKTDIKGFKRFLDKYGIDYAITKDPSQTPPRYLVFFKARDGDAMTAAFKEYSAFLLQKQKKPSVLKQLNKLKQLVASMPAKVRQKKQERDL